jgi:hypothetical protein
MTPDSCERLRSPGRETQAAKSSEFAIVEVMIGPKDLLPITRKYIRASAKKAQLKCSAQTTDSIGVIRAQPTIS